MYFNGQGALDQNIATGAASPGAPPANVVAKTTATVGGVPATVLFTGMTPGAVGLAQCNIQVPTKKADGTPFTTGDYPVILTVSGISTPAGNISIK